MKHKDEKDARSSYGHENQLYTSPQIHKAHPFLSHHFRICWLRNLVAAHDDMKQDLIAEVELSQERVPSSPSMATELHLIDVFLLMVLT